MAISGFEPSPLEEPSTERVPGGRRAAVAVVVVAVLVLGTLIWKPWESGHAPPPSTHPISSGPAVAVAATAGPTQTPIASVPPPTPEGTPAFFSGPQPIEAPLNLGFVELPPDDGGTFVYCIYGGKADARQGLITMVVNPPVVTMGSASRGLVSTVTFRPEIEVNSLEGVFSSEWSSLTKGRNQRTPLERGLVALFKSQRVKVDVGALPASAVLRVAIVINWIGQDGNQVASQRLYPTAYAPLGDTATDPIPEGCPAHN